MFIKESISAITKLFTYKNGALFLVNGGATAGVMVAFGNALDTLIKDTSTKHLIFPFFIYVGGWIVYFLFSVLDLLTGLWNAKYQNSILPVPDKSYIKTHLLYGTLWKGLGITIFGFMIMLTCVVSALMGGDYTYNIILWCSVTFWLMASSFEFRSIGQNIEKRIGKLYAMFAFMDPIINFAQRSIILKVKKSVQTLEETPEKIQENEDIN